MLMEAGTYSAVVKDGFLYERGESKRLSLALKFDVGGTELKGDIHIELNDGTISERALKNIREVFPAWDGAIETLQDGACLRDIEASVVVENEAGLKDPTKTYTKVKWINPPGRTVGGANMPERAEAKSLAAKYGAKFRALSGGVPPAKKPVAKPTAAKPAPRKEVTATADEAWAAMEKSNPLVPEDEKQGKWFEFIELVAPGKASDALTPAEFGKLKAHIEANPL